MDLTTLVDVAIGLAVLYLGASLFVTIVNEYIAQALKMRASQLKRDLATLIDDPKLVASLVKNPALAPLFAGASAADQAADANKKEVRPPASFVDPNVLAQQLVGALGDGKAVLGSGWAVLEALEGLPGTSKIKSQLQALASTADRDMGRFIDEVGSYLDRSLTALGEVYKKRMQWISFGVGMAIAVMFNLDTIGVAKRLYQDKEARSAAVSVALQLQETGPKDHDRLTKCLRMGDEELRKADDCKPVIGLVEAIRSRNETLGRLPIGWNCTDEALFDLSPWTRSARPDCSAEAKPAPAEARLAFQPAAPVRWAGLLLTALAISLGASFWFDLLNRLVNVRHGMRKPQAEVKTAEAAT